MSKKTATKVVSALICAAVMISVLPMRAVLAQYSKTQFVSRLNFDIDDDTIVRAIIIYDGDSAAEIVQKGQAESTGSASKTVISRQSALRQKICQKRAKYAFSYSVLLNGAAVDVSYKDLKQIEKIPGIKKVYLANSYLAPVTAEEPQTSTIAENFGQSFSNGKGALIAVLDTSFNVNHEAFSSYGVSETLTKDRMEAIRDSAKGLNGYGVYHSAKIPFMYDYFGSDTDVSSDMSHGTSVAGIAAGNNGGTYSGVAPCAQILAMKIFDDTTGITDSSIYFAALEDAYMLGADCINMSIGSQNGFSYDLELENEVYGNIYQTLTNEGVFIIAAAGNEASEGYYEYAYNQASRNNNINAVTQDYADYGVLGSPASYDDVIAVGSVNNTNAIQSSIFSSWGCTPELKLKPDICGVGNNVVCPDILSNQSYKWSSGTSMATPVVSGYFAAMKAYYRNLSTEPYASYTNKQLHDLVYGLMLSSARYNNQVSPRHQGAGVASTTHISNAYFSNPIVNLGEDECKDGIYSFTVYAYSLQQNTVVSLGNSFVLTDYCVNYEGSTYNTLNSKKLSATVCTDKENYVLSSTPTEITVTISLSTEDKAYLNSFPNGAFVEGYINFNVQGFNYGPHNTFMGFYGDWHQAPVMEKYDWGDIVDIEMYLQNTYVDGTNTTLAENGYTYFDLLDFNVGYNECYTIDENGDKVGVIGDNLYTYVKYEEKRMAFSTAIAECSHVAESFLLFPALLRNVRHIIMTVENANTGEVYYVDDTEYAVKNYFEPLENAYMPGTMFMWDGTYIDKAQEKQYVANDTEVKVRFQTQLAGDNAPLVTEREYIMVVDYEAPKVQCVWDAEQKTLAVSATDNQYIANIFVYNNNFETIYIEEAVEISEKNEEYTAVYDLSKVDFGLYTSLMVNVQDYATNYVTVTVPLEAEDIITGDINGDGEADNIDAAMILKYDAGTIELNEKDLAVGDVNGDGFVDNLDAGLILKYECGLIGKFNVG